METIEKRFERKIKNKEFADAAGIYYCSAYMYREEFNDILNKYNSHESFDEAYYNMDDVGMYNDCV